MSRVLKQPFSFSGRFLAKKDFVFNGKPFNRGEEFDYEEEGADERKVRTMYNAGFLMRPPPKEIKEDDEGVSSKEDRKKERARERRNKRRAA